MSSKKMPIFDLDEEEQGLSDSYDRGEWKDVKNLKAEKQKAQDAAKRYLAKNKRINIRISESDVDMLKQRAAHEGMPYQTLITSVLHRYVAGHL